MKVTIATHNGSKVHVEHNRRNEKVVSKEEHIDPNGHHETWVDEPIRDAYHRLFDEYVKRYNERQQRNYRKIDNYYNEICKDAKKHPAYEMIVGVYPQEKGSISEEQQRDILREFVETWKERNPNLEMIGAYYHADELGEPHVHIDYIPIAHHYSRGLEVQTAINQALEEQGFEKIGKVTPQIAWERSENKYLERLCEERGLTVERPKRQNQHHLETELYKAQKASEEAHKQLDEANKQLAEVEKAVHDMMSIEQAKTYANLLHQLKLKELQVREREQVVQAKESDLNAEILVRATEMYSRVNRDEHERSKAMEQTMRNIKPKAMGGKSLYDAFLEKHPEFVKQKSKSHTHVR